MKNLFNRKARRAGAQEPRASTDIQADYRERVMRIGEFSFQIEILKSRINQEYGVLNNLGNEMNQALAKEAKAKADAAAKEAQAKVAAQ